MNPSFQPPSSRTSHLSDERLDAILLGESATSDREHLAGCETCADRIAEFSKALASFKQASAGWSEARSNGITRELPPRRLSHTTAAAWSLASVTILAVALAFTGQLHHQPGSQAIGMQQNQPERASHPREADQREIANDNAMLVAIDSAISQPVPSPVAAGSPSAPRTQSGTREARD